MSSRAKPGTRGLGGEPGAHSYGRRRLDLDAETRIVHGLGPTIEAGGSMGARQINGESTQPSTFSRSESTPLAKDRRTDYDYASFEDGPWLSDQEPSDTGSDFSTSHDSLPDHDPRAPKE